jgi:hypothetical protein
MNKETFLKLASELFDQSNPQTEKAVIGKNVYDELTDQIASELNDLGKDIVGDYELEMYSNEVTLYEINLDIDAIESAVKNVLDRYFEVK